MKPRTYFYFPKKKVSSETNTKSFSDRNYTELPINEQIEKTVSDSLLEQNFIPKTQFDINVMNALRSQVTFYSMETENDDDISKDFDILTIPKEAYSKLKPHLRFELDSDHFTLSNPTTRKTISFAYDENLIPVLKCLETKCVSPELYELLKIIDLDLPEEGRFICECLDFRTEEPIESYILMRINLDTILQIIPGNRDTDGYEIEKQVLLFTRQEICVDPSPDVGRFMSIIDWREKMWSKSHPSDSKSDFVPVPKPILQTHAKHIAPPVTTKKIHLSDSLQSVFASIGQHPI